MTETFQETPVYESHTSERPLDKGKYSKGHVLVGLGLFILFVQLVPGNLFLPLLLIGAGLYDLNQRGGSIKELTRPDATINRGHALVGLGAFFLLVQVVPGSLFLPLLLIGAGIYFLRRSDR